MNNRIPKQKKKRNHFLADWFVGLVDGDGNDDEGDEAAVVVEEEPEQHQNEYLNDNEDEEVEIPPREVSSSQTPRVSSSPSSRVRVSSIPPRPQVSRRGWQEWSIFFDIQRCPMILKPFACLIQLILVVAVGYAILIPCMVYFFGMILFISFFGGEFLMYNAIYGAKKSNMLKEKYKNEGVTVVGNVERIWSDWEYCSGGSDSPDFILVERALIRYEYEDDQYRMRIMPLTKHVKNSIGPQDMIPIVLLPRDPESGIPETCVASLAWSPLSRILLFTFGLAISTLWTMLPVCFLMADEDEPDGYFRIHTLATTQPQAPRMTKLTGEYLQ